APPWSMTTRRLRPPAPPPPRGRSGRFGLLPPLAIRDTSVKAAQLRADADLLPEYAREHPAIRCSLEAGDVAARVGAAARLVAAGHEHALAGREPQQIPLRRAPAATGAAPHGRAYEDSSSGAASLASTGMPAGTSSGSATSASGAPDGPSASP